MRLTESHGFKVPLLFSGELQLQLLYLRFIEGTEPLGFDQFRAKPGYLRSQLSELIRLSALRPWATCATFCTEYPAFETPQDTASNRHS